MDVEQRLQQAVQSYWDVRTASKVKQSKSGKLDTGARSEVTAGTQMRELERLVTDILCQAGLNRADVRTESQLELPGFFRATKKWDLLVVSDKQLVLAMEFKSQAGGSIGNNINNRAEEAVGSAQDIWTAFREDRLGPAQPPPFLGYLFLLEDRDNVNRPVRNKEPHFPVDPEFRGVEVGSSTRHGRGSVAGQQVQPPPRFGGISYAKRYELLCRRLVRERLYTSACFFTATNTNPRHITQPAEDLTFLRFTAALRGQVTSFLLGRSSGSR